MADQRINSVISEEAQRQVEALTQGIREAGNELSNFQKIAGGIEVNLGSNTSMQGLSRLINDMNEAISNQSRLTKEQMNLQKQQEQLEQQILKTKQASYKVLQDEERAKQQILKTEAVVNKARAAEEKQVIDLTNDYKMLSKATTEAQLRAKNYALQLGANHQITVQAIADAKLLSDRMKSLDASVGQYSRNVGNYNMVGAQFNQLLSELPNLAQSLPIFLQSIGNNISFLAQSLGATSIGLVAIINLAVLAMIQLGNQFKNSGSEATKAQKANEKYAQSLKNIDDNANKAAYEEVSRVRVLIGVATDETAAREKRNHAVNELQKLYPNYLKNIDDEAIKSGQAAGKIKELTEAIIQNAVAKAASEKYAAAYLRQTELASANAEAVGELVDAQRKLNQVNSSQFADSEQRGLAQFSAQEAVTKARKNREEVSQEYDAAIREANEYQRIAEEALSKIPDLFTKEPKGKTSKNRVRDTVNIRKQILDEISKYDAESAKKEIEIDKRKQETIINNEKASLEDRQQARYQYAMDVIALASLEERSEQEKNENENAATIARIKSQVKNEKEKNELLELENERYLTKSLGLYQDFLVKQNDAILDYQDKAQDDFQKIEDIALKATMKRLEDINSASAKSADIRKKQWKDFYDKIVDGAFDAADEIIKAFANSSKQRQENELDRLDRERERLESNSTFEIEKIKLSKKTEEEKAEAISELQARNSAQLLDIQRREAEAKRRAAQADKDAAIARIILATAEAVIKALATTPGPVGVANAALAGASGAAQLAIAQATPLPQYATGTLDHKGGKFIAGDGGEREMIIEPSGRVYMSKDKATMYDAPKHTKVLTQDMIMQMAYGLGRPIRQEQQTDKKLFKDIENAIDKGSKRTVRAIQKYRSISTVNVSAPSSRYERIVKGN